MVCQPVESTSPFKSFGFRWVNNLQPLQRGGGRRSAVGGGRVGRRRGERRVQARHPTFESTPGFNRFKPNERESCFSTLKTWFCEQFKPNERESCFSTLKPGFSLSLLACLLAATLRLGGVCEPGEGDVDEGAHPGKAVQVEHIRLTLG